MLTLLPMLTQVILIVVWAMFLIMVGAPLTSSPALDRARPDSTGETAGPSPMIRGKGRPSRLKSTDQRPSRPISNCRSC